MHAAGPMSSTVKMPTHKLACTCAMGAPSSTTISMRFTNIQSGSITIIIWKPQHKSKIICRGNVCLWHSGTALIISGGVASLNNSKFTLNDSIVPKTKESQICVLKQQDSHERPAKLTWNWAVCLEANQTILSIWKRQERVLTSSVGLDFPSQLMIAAGLLYGWYPLSTLIGCGGATWVAIESTASTLSISCWICWCTCMPVAKKETERT